MTKRLTPDWERIEREYRVDQLSLRMLADRHGISDTAIRKRAKQYNWVKDLGPAVQREIKARLVRENGEEVVRANLLTDEEIVKIAATTGVDVVRAHRRDIRKSANIALMLMDQLEDAAKNREEIEDDIEEETKGDRDGARRSRMLRAVSLPQHAGTLLNLSAAVKNFVTLERIAFNLDEKNDGTSFEEELEKLMSGDD